MTGADLENPLDAMTRHCLDVTANMPPRATIEIAERMIIRALQREANVNTSDDAAELARQVNMWGTRLRGQFVHREGV